MLIQQWINDRVVPAFEDAGIPVTSPARELLLLALNAQIQEGVVQDTKALIRAVDEIPLKELPGFYKLKYGERPLSFNRTVRLLADLHERWIDARHSAAVPDGDC